jgi:hypothetical protein
MADQLTDFIRVLDALDKHGVDYILIGGVAIILHGMQRLTRDIDIFIRMVPENVGRLREALNAVFDDSNIDEITFEELSKYPVIRYGTPNGFYIDIMARLGQAVTFEDLEYETIDYRDTKIRIGTPESLYKLKKDTVRDRDKIDAAFLERLIEARQSSDPGQ